MNERLHTRFGNRRRAPFTEKALQTYIKEVNGHLEASGSNYRIRWSPAYGVHFADVTYVKEDGNVFSGCLYQVGGGRPRECRDAVMRECSNLHGKVHKGK